MRRIPISTASSSAGEISAWRSCKRSFATARIWSVTATTLRPAQVTGTRSGKAGRGEVESGTTTTVRRRSLIKLAESTTQGRVLLISEPSVGLSRTHQISPRRGVIPGLCNIVGDGIKFPLNPEDVRILIGNVAGCGQFLILRFQTMGEGLRHIAGAIPGGNMAKKLPSNLIRNGEGHLSGCHNTIIPSSLKGIREISC